MNLSEEDIEKIAELLFLKLLEKQNNYEKNNHQYMIYDDFGNSTVVSESEFYHYELERLSELEYKYAKEEDYEKANIIKNKILKIKNKLNKL